jgi:hypothetical protein
MQRQIEQFSCPKLRFLLILEQKLRISNLFTEILHSMESEEETGVHWSTNTAETLDPLYNNNIPDLVVTLKANLTVIITLTF